MTPGMLAYVVVGPDEEAVERIKEHPLVRLLCVLLPSETFRKLGIEPPLGGAGSGFHDFLPTRVSREEGLRIAEAIPPRTLDYYAFCGTVDQIVDEFARVPRGGPPAPDPLEHHRVRRPGPGGVLLPGPERDPRAAAQPLMARGDEGAVPDAIRRYFDGLNGEDWEDFSGHLDGGRRARRRRRPHAQRAATTC